MGTENRSLSVHGCIGLGLRSEFQNLIYFSSICYLLKATLCIQACGLTTIIIAVPKC
jgi:hypothetical protein